MANSSTRSQFMVFVLGGGGVVAILGGAFAIFLAGTLASSNAEFRVRLAELGMLSETIANTSENAATGNHIALSEACRAMEASQREVDKLYLRWQELEARREA